ncbi:hypothetical protein AB0E63_45860 [Kribbella sp. NPDC026596]|uniref:hypothetical protein n=1 Tax=Kribbella sp. NPDC026596 TaxID=3155122 RepID=UPI0034002BD5
MPKTTEIPGVKSSPDFERGQRGGATTVTMFVAESVSGFARSLTIGELVCTEVVEVIGPRRVAPGEVLVMASSASSGSGDEADWAAPAPSPSAKLRPGRVWYWVALLVFVAGLAWLLLGLVLLNNRIDSFERVAVPGQGEVSLDHSGSYVIYYEGPGAAAGNVPAFDLTVTPVSAPAEVQSLEPHSGSVTYSFGSREGRAVLTLEVTQPGKFLIKAPGAPAVAGGSWLAVGSSIAGGIVRVVVPSVVAMLAAVGGAIAVALVRHSRAKRARSPAP